MAQLESLIFGQRLRHFRRQAQMTLDQLGAALGRPPSYLSQLENGHREPRLSTVSELAGALGCAPADLLDTTPPNRRASLEVTVAHLQEDPRFAALKLPYLRPSARLDDVALEYIVSLWNQVCGLTAQRDDPAPDPEHGRGARSVNTAMRDEMRDRDNYYGEIEAVADKAVDAMDHGGPAPVSERALADLAAYFGFTVNRVQDLPPSTRSITDMRHRVIFVPQRNDVPTRTARSLIAQTLGHFALGHRDPADFEEYVRQRVEANYFAGALLAPERVAIPLLREAKEQGDISVEDLSEVFYISYDMRAHRLTNLITRHFGIRVHFLRSDIEGVIWKAYENNGVPLPAAADGTIEGQRVCRHWGARQAFASEDSFALHYQYLSTPAGEFWCTAHIEAPGADAVTVGTRAGDARWFRGHETTRRFVSRCPDPDCCRRPPADVVGRWEGVAWPSARDRSHFVSGLPTDAVAFSPFPSVDLTDVYGFLDRHRPAAGSS